MIYMGGDLQKKIIPMFHYALNPNGVLFLGTSETVGEFIDLFAILNCKEKLYQRKENPHGTRHMALSRFLPPLTQAATPLPRASGKMGFPVKLPLQELTEAALLAQVAPAGALVSGSGDVLYLHGRTGMYLEPAPGEAGPSNIVKMAREGLRHPLAAALRKAADTKELVRVSGLRVKTNSHFTAVDLTVSPLTPPPAQTETPLYLIVLEEAPPAPESAQSAAGADQKQDTDARVAALQAELRLQEEYLRNATEKQETSNEELESSNEEMQSVNEELQSTNEELETAKEEMQSANEELNTVNNELQTKVLDLSWANNDMNNLLASVGIATILLDHQLCILRFTSAATRIFNLIPEDIGRPIKHIVSNLIEYDSFIADAQAVLDTLTPKVTEVRTKDGRWYTLTLQPYRTQENVIKGAVATFINITETKKSQAALDVVSGSFKTMFTAAPLGIALIDSLTGHICDVNPMFANIAGRTMAELSNMTWMNITHPDDLRKNLDNTALMNAGKINGFHMEKRCLHHDGTAVWVNMTVAHMPAEDKAHPRHLCMIEDITERKKIEELLLKANKSLRLAVVVRDSHDAITVQDLDGRTLAWNPGAVRLYGWSEAEALAMNARDRIPEERRGDALAKIHKLSQAEILEPYRTQRLAKSGKIIEVTLISTALINEAGKMYAIATTERPAGGTDLKAES